MPAGELSTKFTFWSISTIQGDLGTRKGDPVAQFSAYGKLIARFGGEEVMAARLTSRQPYTLTVRSTSQTRQVTGDWYCTDPGGTKYNIRSVADPNQRREWLEMLVETGVAD